jgi:hypothetical protein
VRSKDTERSASGRIRRRAEGENVIVSTVQEGYPALTAAAGLGLAIVLTTTVLARRHGRQEA